MAARLTQAVLEPFIVGDGTSKARLCQAVVEVFVFGPTTAKARLTQATVEVYVAAPALTKARLSQAAIEFLLGPPEDSITCTIIVDPPDIVHVPLVCTIDIDEGDEGANLCRELNKD